MGMGGGGWGGGRHSGPVTIGPVKGHILARVQ